MSANFQLIVHLDLKGAPWQVEYLAKVIKVAKSWGATGVLFEWEDTFPFTGELTCVGSIGGANREGLYSENDIQLLLTIVKEEGLVPIQLIQTIGHMEYVLKHTHFSRLRELSQSPAVLCPTRPESMPLLQNMISQILRAQPDAQYIHIGADEAWHVNICPLCRKKTQHCADGKTEIFIDHIIAIAKFIKTIRPEITILMWDDMIRTVDEKVLDDYDLGAYVQPVVWNYAPIGQFQLEPAMWTKYRHVFPKTWAASAFKGANGSCQIISPVARYASNQEAWINELRLYEKEQMSFGGIIFTGWSRYDHYATLCELLPVSLPSLASCLRMWSQTEQIPDECLVNECLISEEWPGELLAKKIHQFVILREKILQFLNGDLINTWLNYWQLQHDYTNPLQVEHISIMARQFFAELSSLITKITHDMSICGPRSTLEWVGTYGFSLKERLSFILNQTAGRTAASISPRSQRRPHHP